MAEETKTTEAGEVVIPEAKAELRDPSPSPSPRVVETENANRPSEDTVAKTLPVEKNAASSILISVSFKEESNLVADLRESEKKALDDLKKLIQAALANSEFNAPHPPPPKPEETETEAPKPEETVAADTPPELPPNPEVSPAPLSQVTLPANEENTPVVDEDGAKTVEAIQETVVSVTLPPPAADDKPPSAETEAAAAPPPPQPEKKVFLWGVPLLGDEKSDTVLLKFLRARNFKVKEALAMIKSTLIWREQFGIESLLEEDLVVPELEKVVFYQGQDKDGHPVCYNVYGELQDRVLYDKTFGDEEKRGKFLKWRILLLEKGVRKKLDFNPGKVCTMVQVTDLKNVLGLEKKELRQAMKKALALLQDNYPEFVVKQVFVNVPWWYFAYHHLMSSFFSQRIKSKFVLASPSKTAETLFKYISPEHVPIQYGGLSKFDDPDFTTDDAVNEITVKPLSKHTIELPATEPCIIVWELRVLAWDVSYGAEFIPNAEDGYTVIAQKVRKLISTDDDDPFVKNSFKVGEPGKIILTIDNTTSKKKKLLYRSKTKESTEST